MRRPGSAEPAAPKRSHAGRHVATSTNAPIPSSPTPRGTARETARPAYAKGRSGSAKRAKSGQRTFGHCATLRDEFETSCTTACTGIATCGSSQKQHDREERHAARHADDRGERPRRDRGRGEDREDVRLDHASGTGGEASGRVDDGGAASGRGPT